VAQDLPDQLVGAAIIGFGTGFPGPQGGQATPLVVRKHLVIALAAKAIFLGRLADPALQALAFDEHEEPVRLLVGDRHCQGAGRAGELLGMGIKLERCIHAGKLTPDNPDV